MRCPFCRTIWSRDLKGHPAHRCIEDRTIHLLEWPPEEDQGSPGGMDGHTIQPRKHRPLEGQGKNN